ncbi:hypothetical protein [Pedobacter sp. SYSU D00535]|uniref:hypothetical protein n=1 Tax=Pedobacter sp. SYSU D00535 TaxID=2810308 RepID=UPI001A971623|nr:hypothetical protein [Pedobacter sp. SYSU D00535]
MNIKIISLAALFFLSSCLPSPSSVLSLLLSDPDTGIVGKWDFRTSYLPGQEDGFKAGEVNVSVENLVNSDYIGSYYVFNADGTYRSLHTEGLTEEYIEGRWSFDEKDSLLRFETNKATQQKIFKVNYLKNNKLSLSDVRPAEQGKKTSYLDKLYTEISHHYTFQADEDVVDTEHDYTVREANDWRIKPQKPETDGQIRERIAANIDYAIMYLDAHLESKKKSIRYAGLASPFMFASNGIALHPMERVKAWKDMFYSYEQAVLGHGFLKEAFATHIKVPENKSHVELQRHLLVEIKRQVLKRNSI